MNRFGNPLRLAGAIAALALAAASTAFAPPALAGTSTVTAGGVSATITINDASFNSGTCTPVPVQVTTTGPGTLALQAATGTSTPATGGFTAQAAGPTTFFMQICPATNGAGLYTVQGTFTSGGAQAPIPPGLQFTMSRATTSFRSLGAQVKGSKTTVTGQVVAVTPQGAIGATGVLTLSVKVPKSLGGNGKWAVLGTPALVPSYGTFNANYPASKVPKGSTVRAAFTGDPWCANITQTTAVR